MAIATVRIARNSEGQQNCLTFVKLKKRPLRVKRVPFTAAETQGERVGTPTRVKCGGGFRVMHKKPSNGNY